MDVCKSMKFAIDKYIENVIPVKKPVACFNTGEFGTCEWVGFTFAVREDLDDYNNVEEWRFDSSNVIDYAYRDFQDGNGSTDVIRREFSLWFCDYVGTDFINVMIASEKVVYLENIKNKKSEGKPLTKLQEIAYYVHNNRYKFSRKV